MTLHPNIARKIMDINTLMTRIKHWRAVGGSIVFTNGCFDILHTGHVQLLSLCREQGDYVILGLNSDASVRRLKGATRPLNDQRARAAVLAALESVDAVIVFEEDTPLELITQIKPDILVKGGDYTISEIAGADFVKRNGGQVVIVPLVAGFSTTAIINKK